MTTTTTQLPRFKAQPENQRHNFLYTDFAWRLPELNIFHGSLEVFCCKPIEN